MPDQARPFFSHLLELRRRVVYCLLALVIGIGGSFLYNKQLIELLKRAGGHPDLYIFTLTGALGPVMKVSMLGGVIVALPVTVYQLIRFVAPALTAKERRYLYLFIPAVGLFFLVGAAFAYFILIPPMVKFLLNFGSQVGIVQVSLESYINTVVALMFWMGIAFETPFVMYVLTLFHVGNPRFFARGRRIWAVIAFILGAIITPTFDPVNQALVAGPFILLYEIGILMSRLAARKQRARPGVAPIIESNRA